jgi:signal peptidase I
MGKKDPYVKTIIGMPGETVTLDDEKNTVQICQPSSGCFLLDQSKILPPDTQTHTVSDKKVFTLTK